MAETAGPAGEGAEPGDDLPGDDLPGDETELLAAFDRLAPQGSVRWNFEDAMGRLSSSDRRATSIEPWLGLPADLWERGRGTKASERVMGDVVRVVAQELTEYTQRLVADVRETSAEASPVFDALRFLAARVDQLEAAADPLGMRPAELALATPDVSEWAGSVPSWIGDRTEGPVVVGELADLSVLEAVAVAGLTVTGVDPRGATVWAAEAVPGLRGSNGAALADVVRHLQGRPADSLSGVVLSGCIDRVSLGAKVDLVDAALRALAPSGALVLLVSDQEAWDASLSPPVRDLLPGRPLHPETWLAILAHRGLHDVAWHRPVHGSVHAVVAGAARPRVGA
ncbi:MAG: hypothetical protein ABSB09_11125 [Acidimicrobiales bacterium]